TLARDLRGHALLQAQGDVRAAVPGGPHRARDRRGHRHSRAHGGIPRSLGTASLGGLHERALRARGATMNDDELEAWAAAYRVARKPSAQTRRAIERAVRNERSARPSRTRQRHALRWAVCSVGLL